MATEHIFSDPDAQRGKFISADFHDRNMTLLSARFTTRDDLSGLVSRLESAGVNEKALSILLNQNTRAMLANAGENVTLLQLMNDIIVIDALTTEDMGVWASGPLSQSLLNVSESGQGLQKALMNLGISEPQSVELSDALREQDTLIVLAYVFYDQADAVREAFRAASGQNIMLVR